MAAESTINQDIINEELYIDNVLIIGDSILKETAHVRNAQIRAYRGDTLEDLNNHIKENKELLMDNKKVAVIHAGTNDLYNSTVEEMLDDLENLILSIREKNKYCHIAVSPIIPRPRDYWTTMVKIQRFNKEVKLREDIWAIRAWRCWRPFSRNNKPRRQMYKMDGLHPSKKGAICLSQYLAKQCAMLRKECSIPRNKRRASETIVTKKPRNGYGYPGERKRRRLLYKPIGQFPKEPTYGSGVKDVHRPNPNKQRLILVKKNLKQTIIDMRDKMEAGKNKGTSQASGTSARPVKRPTDGKIKSILQCQQILHPPKKNHGQKKAYTLKMKKKMKKTLKKAEGLNKPKTQTDTEVNTKDPLVVETTDRIITPIETYHSHQPVDIYSQQTYARDGYQRYYTQNRGRSNQVQHQHYRWEQQVHRPEPRQNLIQSPDHDIDRGFYWQETRPRDVGRNWEHNRQQYWPDRNTQEYFGYNENRREANDIWRRPFDRRW